MSVPITSTSTFPFAPPLNAGSASSGTSPTSAQARQASFAQEASTSLVQAWNFRDDTYVEARATEFTASASGSNSKPSSKPRWISSDDGELCMEKHAKWSQEETEELVKGCSKWGVGNWKAILNDPDLTFDNRFPVDLKDRFRTFFPDAYREHYPNAKTHLSSELHPSNPDGTSIFAKTRSRKQWPFTAEEDAALKAGYEKHGTIWAQIVKDPIFAERCRRSTDLRDRFRNAFPELYRAAGCKPRASVSKSSKTMDAAKLMPQFASGSPVVRSATNVQLPSESHKILLGNSLGLELGFEDEAQSKGEFMSEGRGDGLDPIGFQRLSPSPPLFSGYMGSPIESGHTTSSFSPSFSPSSSYWQPSAPPSVASSRPSTSDGTPASSSRSFSPVASSSRASSTSSWYDDHVHSHASGMNARDDAELANRLKEDTVIDFDVFLTKMVLERKEPYISFEFAINAVLGLASRRLYGFDASKNGFGSAPLELQLRTISSALQVIRASGTTVDHENFRGPLLDAIEKLEKTCKSLQYPANPNIRFLCKRIKKDGLALKNNRTKLQVAMKIGLAISSAVLHLYEKRLLDAIDQLQSIHGDVVVIWDTLLAFFDTLKSAADGNLHLDSDQANLDWERAIEVVKSGTLAARKANRFGTKSDSSFIAWEFLDALESCIRDDEDPDILAVIGSLAEDALTKYPMNHDKNSSSVHWKALEVLVSLRAAEGGEELGRAKLLDARANFVNAVHGRNRAKALALRDQTVQEVELYCSQRDRLYDHVMNTFTETTLNVLPTGSVLSSASGGIRKILECPISGHLMIDAVALNCGHIVSAQALDAQQRFTGRPNGSACCENGRTAVVHLIPLSRHAVKYLVEVGDVDELEYWGLLEPITSYLATLTRWRFGRRGDGTGRKLDGVQLRTAISRNRNEVEKLVLKSCGLSEH